MEETDSRKTNTDKTGKGSVEETDSRGKHDRQTQTKEDRNSGGDSQQRNRQTNEGRYSGGDSQQRNVPRHTDHCWR